MLWQAFVEHEAHDEEDHEEEHEEDHDHAEHDHAEHSRAHMEAVYKGLVVLCGIYVFFLVERLMKIYSNSKSSKRRVSEEPTNHVIIISLTCGL